MADGRVYGTALQKEHEGVIPLKALHQIELTTRCNLACRYCPHPKLERPKADMSWETFDRTLEHIAYYVRHGEQWEVSLTGLGEGTLHPDFIPMTEKLRGVLGWDRLICFSTNGITFDREMARDLRRLAVGVFVSLHRPEVAGPAVELAKEYQILLGAHANFTTSAYDWAGQVKWYNSGPRTPCMYLTEGRGVVLQDGSISTCCWDGHGKNIIGHVDNDLGSLTTRPFPLCEKCHHTFEAPNVST